MAKSKSKQKPITTQKKSKLPMSASHLSLYVMLFVFITVTLLGVGAIVYMIILLAYGNVDIIDFIVQLFIGLFSYTGVCVGTISACYEFKAKAEKEYEFATRKYESRLELAEKICDKMSNGELDANSIILLKELISDSETTISGYGGYGGFNVIDETKYAVPSPTISVGESEQHNLRGE